MKIAAIVLAAALGTACGQVDVAAGRAALEKVTVYRSKTCTCCGKWVRHMRDAGFEVADNVIDKVDDAPDRSRVPASLRSCHRGTAGRYAIEGHIPADVVKKLLADKPAVDGIAVPGMPAGSPGMESPAPVSYDVIAFDTKGQTSVFARR